MALNKFTKELKKLELDTGYSTLTSDLESDIVNGDSTLIQFSGNVALVVKPIFNNGELGLFVHLGVSRELNALHSFNKTLDELAALSGFKFIQFKSKRKGFARIATSLGYHASGVDENQFTIYQKEV